MRTEIKYILETLEIKNPSASTYRSQLIEVLDDSLALISFADKLKQETQATKDFPDDRIPFYDLFLAVAWHENNIGTAKEFLSKAVHDFRIRDFALDEALGEWLFSIFHFENQKYDRAHRACETSISILQQLIKRCEEESKYRKADELGTHLSELEIFLGLITPPLFPASSKTKNSSADDTALAALRMISEDFSIKVKLQYFYDELNQIRKHLKEQNERMPVTLVAAAFYLYKTITPSHSVYRKVPPPKTRTEKVVYDELLNKVGFFEVIEQLVELERDVEPNTSREELLIKINHDWDKEVGK
jgi:hypothetical protein